VYIDRPLSGATISGVTMVSGWAIDNLSSVGTAISSVQVLVDGVAVGTATHGGSRNDVCAAYPGRPNCPNVGFTYPLNTSGLSAGTHKIRVVAIDTDGTPDSGFAEITVTVGPPPVPPAVYIDRPLSGSTISGTVSVSGWAIDNLSSVGTAISSVQVLVDGVAVGNATYGSSHTDVCAAYPGRPNCPNVGFTYALNTNTLSAGSHKIRVLAIDTDGTPDSGFAEVTVFH
jgi:Bacterial Ig domain